MKMNLFILFTLFCGIFAWDDPTEAIEKKDYNSQHIYIEHCQTYTLENDIQKECSKCYEGFELSGGKCNRILVDIQNPPYVSGNDIIHPEIGYDTKTNTCTKTIKIVNSNGETEITDDKYSGDKSCLACAQYKADNTCAICVAGYLANNGGCTPLTENTFGENEEDTNKYCIYGEYVNGVANCYACQQGYKTDNNRCIPADYIDSIEGCVRPDYLLSQEYNIFNCSQCIEGYKLVATEREINSKFIFTCITTTSTTAEFCVSVSDSGDCERCMPGYYENSGECIQCKPLVPQTNYFENDECNMIDYKHCECNPNCIQSDNYLSCASRHCDLFSETEMSSKYSGYPKCLRCQQGYKLNAYNECDYCVNGTCKNKDETCVPGYYMSEEGDCRKCEGKCIECVSKTQCKIDKLMKDDIYGRSLNGLPCFDPNCELCDSEDQQICFKCLNDAVLIGGKCYQKANMEFWVEGVSKAFPACRYYEHPEFVNNNNVDPDYSFVQLHNIEHAYLREINKNISEENGYYCKYHDNLPLYYRNYEGNKLECVGENRDKYNDCECLPGYYPENIHKYSNCKKTSIEYCSKAISDTICAKCDEGMVLLNNGLKRKPNYICGCPNTNQRINSHGVCVDCPKKCATCETIYDENNNPKTNCTTCRGEYQFSSEAKELQAVNYNRDPNNICECKDGYKSYSEIDSEIVYSCYEVPQGCSDEGNHNIEMYTVSCNTCDKEGFTVESSCKTCKNSYFGKVDDDTNLIDECVICPEITEGSKQTYCSSCYTENDCSECIDTNLNVTQQCKVCNDGYSMIMKTIVDENGIEQEVPMCIKCKSYCKMDSDNGCFLGEDEEKYDYYKNKEKYTEQDLEKATTVFCDACQETTQDPSSGCKCKNDCYLDYKGFCKKCSETLGEDTFKTIDTEGNTKTAMYSDVCVLSTTEDSEKLCELNMYTSLPECLICKDSNRRPENNCTTCKTAGTYPVYDTNSNKHICDPCNEKCKTCNNKTSCTSCTSANAIGEQCDKCSVGYFIKDFNAVGSSATCVKCPDGCSVCESSEKCTACSKDNHIPGPNTDCMACASGYYFDYKELTCKQIDISKGYAESKAVCLDDQKSEIECKVENRDIIAEVIEIPVRCDTTRGVGISPNPFGRKCVCDSGYLDNRTKEEIEINPIPQCTSIRILTLEDFCIEGKFDKNGKPECTECNADYLELVNGECKCKDTHYQTDWGMCVPCGRHMKGCKRCSEKYKCLECDSPAFKLGEEKDGKRECVGK